MGHVLLDFILYRGILTRLKNVQSRFDSGVQFVANTAQARKRVRQAEQARQRNMALRSQVRTEYKKVLKAVAAGNAEQAQAAYKTAQPVIDRMVNKGILGKNTAARRKSSLVSRIKAI